MPHCSRGTCQLTSEASSLDRRCGLAMTWMLGMREMIWNDMKWGKLGKWACQLHFAWRNCFSSWFQERSALSSMVITAVLSWCTIQAHLRLCSSHRLCTWQWQFHHIQAHSHMVLPYLHRYDEQTQLTKERASWATRFFQTQKWLSATYSLALACYYTNDMIQKHHPSDLWMIGRFRDTKFKNECNCFLPVFIL